jgi:deoxyhypusine synthase
MTANSEQGAPPSSVTDAVLVPSNEMPEGSQKVEELDFNKFAGRDITVNDLISGMNHMGFQASSIGEAVRIINGMVRPNLPLKHLKLPIARLSRIILTSAMFSAPGEIPKTPPPAQPSSWATPPT